MNCITKAVSTMILLGLALSCSDASLMENREQSLLHVTSTTKPVLGLNDVSVLFPYVEHPELFEITPKLNSKRDKDTWRFLSGDTLDAIHRALKDDETLRINEGFAYGGVSEQQHFEGRFIKDQIENFRLVSFRIDPCANLSKLSLTRLDVETNCHAEFRLVWQAMEPRDGGIHARDVNLHLIYKLSQDRFKDLVASLRDIKQRLDPEASISPVTSPLGANPLMLDKRTSEEAIASYLSIVKTFATVHTLKSIAAMGDSAPNFAGHWPMLMMDFKQGQWVARPLENVALSEQVKTGRKPVFLDNGKVEMVEVAVKESVKTVQRINGGMGDLMDPEPFGLINLPFKDRFKLYRNEGDIRLLEAYQDNLEQRANPHLHSVSNLDCGSCHTIDQDKESLLASVEELKENQPSQSTFKLFDWNLEKVYPTPSRTSLQMFSMFLGRYSVRQRVINESALVAERIRQHY